MIEIAEKIIDRLAGPFDPSCFDDRPEDAARAFIEKTAPAEPRAPSQTPPRKRAVALKRYREKRDFS